jgi:hypothetical protein
MNLRKIIEEHRTAQQAREDQARAAMAAQEAAQAAQVAVVRRIMKENLVPLLTAASQELTGCGIETHVTHSEEERGGSTISAWIVSTVSFVIDHRKPAYAQLQFIGTATPHNWQITPNHILPAGQTATDAKAFTGTPEELEPFATLHLERLVRTVFPA